MRFSVHTTLSIAPGVGKVASFECGGRPEEYAKAFVGFAGVTQCVDCKGTGWVYVNV